MVGFEGYFLSKYIGKVRLATAFWAINTNGKIGPYRPHINYGNRFEVAIGDHEVFTAKTRSVRKIECKLRYVGCFVHRLALFKTSKTLAVKSPRL